MSIAARCEQLFRKHAGPRAAAGVSLTARARQLGAPPPPKVVLDVERRYGGYTLAIPGTGNLVCDPAALLPRSGPLTLPTQPPLWRVAIMPDGGSLYLDAAGVAYGYETETATRHRIADSFESEVVWAFAATVKRQLVPPLPSDVSRRVRAAFSLGGRCQPPLRGRGTAADMQLLQQDMHMPPWRVLAQAEQQYGGCFANWVRLGPFQLLTDPNTFARRSLVIHHTMHWLVGETQPYWVYLNEAGQVALRDKLTRRSWALTLTLAQWIEQCAAAIYFAEGCALGVVASGIARPLLQRRLGLEPLLPDSDAGAIAEHTFMASGAWLGAQPDPLADAVTLWCNSTQRAVSTLRTIQQAWPRASVRIHAVPWPSMQPHLLLWPSQPTAAPLLSRLGQQLSPVTQISEQAAAAAPAAITAGLSLWGAWPGERGRVSIEGDTIVQQTAVNGRVVMQQLFAEDSEHCRRYACLDTDTAAAPPAATIKDQRWCVPAPQLAEVLSRSPHAAAAARLEAELGGVQRVAAGHIQRWLGVFAAQHFRCPTLTSQAGSLLPVGEDGPFSLYIDAAGALYRCVLPARDGWWNPGQLPRRIAPDAHTWWATNASRPAQ